MLDAFMKQFSTDMEMEEPFHTEFPGNYTLRLDEDIVIQITEIGNGGLSFSSHIGSYPKENLEAFFTNAMLANLFGQGTKGAILGLSPDGSKITLTRNIPYEIDYKEFRDSLEDFINMVDFWHGEALSPK